MRDTQPRRRWGKRGRQDLAAVHRPGPTRTLLIMQTLHPRAVVAVPPSDHRRPRHPNQLSNLGVGDPVRGQQHNPGPLRQTRPDRTRPRPRLQQLTITRSQAQRLRAHSSFSRISLSNYFRRAALGALVLVVLVVLVGPAILDYWR